MWHERTRNWFDLDGFTVFGKEDDIQRMVMVAAERRQEEPNRTVLVGLVDKTRPRTAITF